MINIYSRSPGNCGYFTCSGADSSAPFPLFAVEYFLLKLIPYGSLGRTSGLLIWDKAGVGCAVGVWDPD